MLSENKKKIGLVLSGGGARAAYHAGALKGLNHLLEKSGQEKLKFDIICGISSGAINGAYLASKADNLTDAVDELWKDWSEIRTEDIINVNGTQIFGKASKLILQLGLGGLFKSNQATELLSTLPLANYLTKKIDFNRIHEHVESGLLYGICITATHYGTGGAIAFFDGSPLLRNWFRSYYLTERTVLKLKHVLASAAIPFVFPPIKIQNSYYGDGAMRMKFPLSPAIHLGADKILAIGIRTQRTTAENFEIYKKFQMSEVQLADISAAVLHSLFLDGLDTDLERADRVNRYIETIHSHIKIDIHPEQLRKIPILAIQPSQDLGKLAIQSLKTMPQILRHMMKGLGVNEQHGADLLSYLAFEKSYTQQLLTLGYDDVLKNKKSVLDWFENEV